MSIIGHSIQNNIANVHVALREQAAGQAAQSESQARRQKRLRIEEEIARESVREADRARRERVNQADAERGPKRRKPASKKAKAADSDEDHDAAAGESTDRAVGGRLDLLA